MNPTTISGTTERPNIAEIISALERINTQSDKLKEESAYLKLQRDALLEMTWLDMPDEPSESTARWHEEFAKGWERKSVSDELRELLATSQEFIADYVDGAPDASGTSKRANAIHAENERLLGRG